MLNDDQKEEFFERLEGSEGCDFKETVPGDSKTVSWKCSGGNDKSLAIKILKAMGIGIGEIDQFLQECHENGGHCDCEIIFNAKERMLE